MVDICMIGTVVSQFTLLASTKKGSKPDFHATMAGAQAKELYDYFYAKVQQGYRADRVKDGVFQAMMQVSLVNDGPVSAVSIYAAGHLLIDAGHLGDLSGAIGVIVSATSAMEAGTIRWG